MTQVTLEMIQELVPDAELRGSGYLHMQCPWHEDAQASLLVYSDGWWHCLGECLASGPNSRLYAELSSTGSTTRATQDIPRGYPPTIPSNPSDQIRFVADAYETIKRNSSFRWYLEKRGLEGRIESCELGWHQGWLVLPVHSPHHDIDGIIMRSGPQAEKLTGLRFTQPSGQKAMMYCPDWSLLSKAEQSIYVVFGMMDALTLSELRLPVVTSTGGAKSFKAEWLEKYRLPIIVVPDKEEAPQAYRLLQKLGWRGKLKMLSYPSNFKDPNDYIQNGHGTDLGKELVGG